MLSLFSVACIYMFLVLTKWYWITRQGTRHPWGSLILLPAVWNCWWNSSGLVSVSTLLGFHGSNILSCTEDTVSQQTSWSFSSVFQCFFWDVFCALNTGAMLYMFQLGLGTPWSIILCIMGCDFLYGSLSTWKRCFFGEGKDLHLSVGIRTSIQSAARSRIHLGRLQDSVLLRDLWPH